MSGPQIAFWVMTSFMSMVGVWRLADSCLRKRWYDQVVREELQQP